MNGLDKMSGYMSLYCALVALWLAGSPIDYMEFNKTFYSSLAGFNILASALNFYYFLRGYFREV